MRVVVQRVKKASVSVDKNIVGSISRGLLIFFASHPHDDNSQITWLAEKIKNLRVFTDANNKMNLSLEDVNGEILIISQFTLYADCNKGRRPSFINAASSDIAKDFYDKFVSFIEKNFLGRVQTGIFQADMQVYSINDGPVTLIIDAK